jgi:hypothetical protein
MHFENDKEIAMRIVSILLVSLVPAAAAAQAPAPLDPASLPASCQQFATSPAPSARLQEAAHISIASCLASERLDALQLGDDPEESRQQLAGAIATSIAMYDQVIAHGEPGSRIMAQHAKGDLYIGAAVRLRTSAPPIPPGSAGPVVLAYRQAQIEPRVRPWIARADRAFAEVKELASEHPELARSPVVGDVIARSFALKAQTGPIIGTR